MKRNHCYREWLNSYIHLPLLLAVFMLGGCMTPHPGDNRGIGPYDSDDNGSTILVPQKNSSGDSSFVLQVFVDILWHVLPIY